jgi:D-beta-D-heptose 7-phosphate kinase/D-beta-D-heptose 1-phosphate adenosyltransferase
MGALDGLRSKKFCVIGDMIVDHYRFVRQSKLSPEAPVIIFRPEREEFRPGGAGNVANNLSALGAQKVFLCSVVGEDWKNYRTHYGDVIAANMPFAKDYTRDVVMKTFVVSRSKRTTIKERVVTPRQQVARIDLQDTTPLCCEDEDALISKATPLIRESDAVVFSDYAHGVMTDRVCDSLMSVAIAAGKPTVIDAKSKRTMSRYRGCTIAMPNGAEARDITGLSDDFSDLDVARFMLKTMRAKAIALTLGKDGVLLVTDGGYKVFPPLAKEEVADVTGAGDTAAAMTAAALGLGTPYDEAMRLSQAAAGVVVRKLGTATASAAEVEAALEEYEGQGHGKNGG